MIVSLLPRHTFRWWFKPPFQRMTLQPSRQYAQGVKWSVRFGPVVLTQYEECGCR